MVTPEIFRLAVVSLEALISILRVVACHDGVEHPRKQQDDEEIDQRHGSGRTEVKLSERGFDQIDRQESGRVARTAAGNDKRLGIDHETIHETQQHGDQKNALHLWQLDIAEYGPTRRTVDLGCLIEGIWNGNEAGIAEQDDQARPMPDIHDDDRHPGIDRILHIVVIDADGIDVIAEQTNVVAAEHLPDRADNVPRDQQWQCHQNQAHGHADARFRHVERNEDAERDLKSENDQRKNQVSLQGGPETVGMQDLGKPVRSVPEELVVSESVLNGIVHNRHQGDDGRERHQHEHWQDQKPRFVVPGFFHDQASGPARQESA
ncbi:hypothetical protein RHECNPAF_2330015 [Rhizobium etli CNPAF512]|nr:hypothetical protein RHECNPAF_2330015 [Rhizobium etli CNPAF512]